MSGKLRNYAFHNGYTTRTKLDKSSLPVCHNMEGDILVGSIEGYKADWKVLKVYLKYVLVSNGKYNATIHVCDLRFFSGSLVTA